MGMTLAEAKTEIQGALRAMAAAFKDEVFDEWALLRIQGGKASVLAYHGPRLDRFKDHLTRDIQPLKAAVAGRHLGVGDLDFAHAAEGERYDAILVAGPGVYLVLNHTRKVLADITADPKWRQAQKPLADLAERFRLGPLA